MTIAAIIHEGGLQRGFNPRYLGQVDIPSKLAPAGRLEIKFLDFVSIHHHNAGLFRVGGIDQHFLCHVYPMRASGLPNGCALPYGMGGHLWQTSGRDLSEHKAGPSTAIKHPYWQGLTLEIYRG